MENSIADDFVSYDCFMQPFDSPDEGDEQTKGLEIEYFYQIDKNNSDQKVATRFFITNLQEHMLILRPMLSNHGASCTVREAISEFFQLELNATYHICTPVTEGELYKLLCWEAQPQGLNPLPVFGSRFCTPL